MLKSLPLRPVPAPRALTTPTDLPSAPQRGARRAVQLDTSEVPEVWRAGYTGRGIGIAVIDTGAIKHPDYVDRLVAFKDFVGSRKTADGSPADAYDDDGHGTGVASAALGDGTLGQATGSAPGAHLVGLKALDAKGLAWNQPVLDAIHWAVENRERYNIRVLNLSFFLDDPDPASHQPVVEALEAAAQAGIIPVVAATNDGPHPQSLHTLASYPHVITVAACDTRQTRSQEDDRIPPFSGRGPGDHGEMKPDVAAPGVDVWVANSRGGYSRSHGTSLAAPLVAGIIATWLEANPALDVDEVQHILATTSHPLAGATPQEQGHGEIHALDGLHAALRLAAGDKSA